MKALSKSVGTAQRVIVRGVPVEADYGVQASASKYEITGNQGPHPLRISILRIVAHGIYN